jgi:alanine racemase
VIAKAERLPARNSGPPPAIRPSRAEVDLAALAHNLHVLRGVAGGARVYGVVKADAYGHGLVPVARALERAGVDGLCVALAEEGLALRAEGVEVPLLVLNGVYGADHARLLAERLVPVVFTIEQVEAFARAAAGRPVGVHLKVDTGMARLGVPIADWGAFLDALAAHPSVRVDGVMTHLASADRDDAATEAQLDRFDDALALLHARGHAPALVHAANSAGTYRFPRARHTMVRAGIGIYGVSPAAGVGETLRPAMRVRTEVLTLKDLPTGAPVGYGGSFRASRPTRIAALPIGYGDGILRAASNRGVVLVRGRRCPIVGDVSMDLTTVDVTDVPGAAPGDEAVVIGRSEGAYLSAAELAAASGTIAYEVLTGFSGRLPRLYVGA